MSVPLGLRHRTQRNPHRKGVAYKVLQKRSNIQESRALILNLAPQIRLIKTKLILVLLTSAQPHALDVVKKIWIYWNRSAPASSHKT